MTLSAAVVKGDQIGADRGTFKIGSCIGSMGIARGLERLPTVAVI